MSELKCCGVIRTTPFCPSCGKKIGNPSPLTELLDYLRKRTVACTEEYNRAVRSAKISHIYSNQWEKHPKVIKTSKNMNQWKMWKESLENFLNDDHVKVHADWLLDNDFVEASERLRGAFS